MLAPHKFSLLRRSEPILFKFTDRRSRGINEDRCQSLLSTEVSELSLVAGTGAHSGGTYVKKSEQSKKNKTVYI